jgi:hypothetical protein
MQKLINLMAVIGFTVSGATVGVATWGYMNRETFVQQLVETLCMQLEPLLQESIKKTLPTQTVLPPTTGPAVPFKIGK